MTARAPTLESSAEVARPRAAVLGSIATGWRRAVGAPWVAVGVLAAALMFAVPLASIVAPQGPSRGFAHALADGAAGAIGLDDTAGLVSRLRAPDPITLPVAGALAGSLVVSLFLSGGILDRLARGRRVGTGAFFSACGVYGVRFLRLTVFIVAAYWVLLASFRPFLRITLGNRTDMLGVLRESFTLQAGLSLGFLAVLSIIGTIVDFAMVRVVVEDRHSAIEAIGASLRFVRRRAVRAMSLYLVNVFLLAGIELVWRWATLPATSPAWARDIVSGSFLLLYAFARLAFMASEAVFFQGELAHAHYTAAPVPTWPDSAAAEAIRNLTMSGRRAEGEEGQRAEGKGQRETTGKTGEGAG
jgi:hypothetical protein